MRRPCAPPQPPPPAPPPQIPGPFKWLAYRIDRFLDILDRLATRDDVTTDLTDVLTELRAIKAQGVQIMATQAQAEAAIAKLNTATTGVGNELARLRQLLETGGLTDEQETLVFNQIGAISDSLIAMAPSAENPIPVPVPPPINV